MFATPAARIQMTYQQVRAWSVLPPEVLAVFDRLAREDFVPVSWRGAAYGDLAIPLGEGQHMLTPSVIGRVLQAVNIGRSDRILEVGTGSGYLTACLALLGQQVHSLEIRPTLAQQARVHLKNAGIGNAEVETIDVFGWQSTQPAWDIIVLTGSLPVYDQRFESLLAPEGRLFVVTGDAPVMDARLISKDQKGLLKSGSLFETVIDPLDHAATTSHFKF